jgi:predicted RNA binding protein YcfA (HicA-like mRNA interferase family)
MWFIHHRLSHCYFTRLFDFFGGDRCHIADKWLITDAPKLIAQSLAQPGNQHLCYDRLTMNSLRASLFHHDKTKKRLEKLRRNTKNVRVDILESIMLDFGFERGKSKSSHVTYRHPSGLRITIASHGAIVPEYAVKTAIAALDQLTQDDTAAETTQTIDEDEDDNNN